MTYLYPIFLKHYFYSWSRWHWHVPFIDMRYLCNIVWFTCMYGGWYIGSIHHLIKCDLKNKNKNKNAYAIMVIQRRIYKMWLNQSLLTLYFRGLSADGWCQPIRVTYEPQAHYGLPIQSIHTHLCDRTQTDHSSKHNTMNSVRLI